MPLEATLQGGSFKLRRRSLSFTETQWSKMQPQNQTHPVPKSGPSEISSKMFLLAASNKLLTSTLKSCPFPPPLGGSQFPGVGSYGRQLSWCVCGHPVCAHFCLKRSLTLPSAESTHLVTMFLHGIPAPSVTPALQIL